jgi:hypothetical protein
MGSTAILAAIDKELARLNEVRATLVKNAKEQTGNGTKKRSTRRLSPAGRARIAEAQRKRWAAHRKRRKKA